jgi:hypothetical protein
MLLQELLALNESKIKTVAGRHGLTEEELRDAIDDYRSFTKFHRGARMYDPSGVKAFYQMDLVSHEKRDALFDALMELYG